MIGRPSRRSESGRSSLSEVQLWSGDSPGCPEVVGMLSRSSESGRKALSKIQKWSGGPPKGPEVVVRPFWGYGIGR